MGTASAAKVGPARNNTRVEPRISLITFMKTHTGYINSYVIRLQTCGESFQNQRACAAERAARTGIVVAYWPVVLSIRLATLTPLNPLTYLEMPR